MTELPANARHALNYVYMFRREVSTRYEGLRPGDSVPIHLMRDHQCRLKA